MNDADLKEIKIKLDMIIRHFNIDGKGDKSASSIKQEASKRVIGMFERRNRRKQKEGV